MDFKKLQEYLHLLARKAWFKPASVAVCFVVFTLLCGFVDTRALAQNYIPRQPITLVEEAYVDPPAGEGCPISQVDNAFEALGSLVIEPVGEAPAAAAEPAAASAVAAAPEDFGTSTLAAEQGEGFSGTIATSVFRSRFEALHVLPPLVPSLPPVVQNTDLVAAQEAQAQQLLEELEEKEVKEEGISTTEKKAKKAGEKEGKVEKAVKVNASPNGGYSKMLSWQKKNSDVMGWLTVPGTNIDYPVVQGADNNYYTHKGYDKNYSYNGVIWADQDVVPGCNNTILYGHNWTNYSANPRIGDPNDVMFAQLTAFQHASFAQGHPYIQYSDANGDATYEIFAAFYTTDINFYIYTNTNPVSLASKAKSLSLHDYGVEVGSSDKILTLSTCTRYYGQFENQRFVVMARKVKSGK